MPQEQRVTVGEAAESETSEKLPSIIFPTTPVEELKDRSLPETAACLIIGDEILNGKTLDTNSNFFAKFCFNLGIDVKRIEVVPDEEDVIIEAVRRLSGSYDFVVTSGGIGATHDDITYPSIARAFDLKLAYHKHTMDRMSEAAKNYKFTKPPSPEAIEAQKRMALFPTPSQVVYPNEKMWVPIVIVNDNVHILPGIPFLFRGLLSGLGKYYTQPRESFVRVFVRTDQPESLIAPVLAEAQNRVIKFGIKVGSYPKWTKTKKWVIVSFLAKERRKEMVVQTAKEVAEEIGGYITDDPDKTKRSKI